MKRIAAIGLLFCLALTACGGQATPDPTAVAQAVAATLTAQAPVVTHDSLTQKLSYGLTREQVLEARKHYVVEVLYFDGTREYGLSSSPTDYVRLRITNGSSVTLPCLTVISKRYNRLGNQVGGSRNPAIPTYNLKPGESAEYDWYTTGRLTDSVTITVEIEHLVPLDSMRFFDELEVEDTCFDVP